jgi:hypothetical protein
MERKTRSPAAKLANPAFHDSEPKPPEEGSSIDKRPARTSAGSSSNGLGGEPRGPNQVLSCHKAVILASATMGLRG